MTIDDYLELRDATVSTQEYVLVAAEHSVMFYSTVNQSINQSIQSYIALL